MYINDRCTRRNNRTRWKNNIENDKYKIKKQISEFYINVEEDKRYETLKNLIYSRCPKSLIIFVNTKDKVDNLYNQMK